MKRKKLGIVFRVVCMAFAMTTGCSHNNSGSTSSHTYSIGEVQWPAKYVRAASSRFCFDVPVTVPDTTDQPYLWYQVSWRRLIQDPTSYYDSSYVRAFNTGTQYCCLNYHNPGAGIYRLRLGLTSSPSDRWNPDKANGLREYSFYVDASYYYHDVDLEYVYQTGCDLFAFSFDYVKDPYKNTRAILSKTDSPNNPAIRELIKHDPEDIRAYKYKVQSFWGGDTSRPSCPYLLCGVDKLVDPNTQQPENITGAAYNDFETSLVAAGLIDSLFGTESNTVKLESAAHELGHIIGRGLDDYCNNPAVHKAGYDCMMKWLKVDLNPPHDIKWCCSTSCGGTFSGGYFNFCDSCLYRLSDLDFLLEDYGGWEFSPDVAFETKDGR